MLFIQCIAQFWLIPRVICLCAGYFYFVVVCVLTFPVCCLVGSPFSVMSWVQRVFYALLPLCCLVSYPSHLVTVECGPSVPCVVWEQIITVLCLCGFSVSIVPTVPCAVRPACCQCVVCPMRCLRLKYPRDVCVPTVYLWYVCRPYCNLYCSFSMSCPDRELSVCVKTSLCCVCVCVACACVCTCVCV